VRLGRHVPSVLGPARPGHRPIVGERGRREEGVERGGGLLPSGPRRPPAPYAGGVTGSAAPGSARAPSPPARPADGLAERWDRSRGRLADAACTAVALLAAAVLVAVEVAGEVAPGAAPTWQRVTATLVVAGALWWRRRLPLAVSLLAAGAVLVGASEVVLPLALLTLAVRRRGRDLAVGVAAGALAYAAVTAEGSAPTDVLALLGATAVLVGAPVLAGAYVGARRELVRALRERAERAEVEQALRAEQARSAERARIAGEMHDVLGHRLSLLALHAGGLEVTPAAGPEHVERVAGLLRTTAHEALEDLRGVLGVLRTECGGPGTSTSALRPQPELADVAALVGRSAAAGVDVRLVDDVPADAVPPALVGRTAHRVVQEALTNVHKHAPGASVVVRLAGAPGGELVVEVSSTSRGSGTATSTPGTGLVGLRERVALAGGRLEAGPQRAGFVVRARLPWAGAGGPPATPEQRVEHRAGVPR